MSVNSIFENDRHDRIILGAQMLSPRFETELLSPPFSSLDYQRMASMSDEGGSAAAIFESQDVLGLSLQDMSVPVKSYPENKIGQELSEAHRNWLKDNSTIVLSATAFGVGLSYYWMRSFLSKDPA